MTGEPGRFRRLTCAVGVALALALAGPASQAAAGTLIPIPSYADPNGGYTGVQGINNAGWMSGTIGYDDGTSVGFIRDPKGVYTTFSVLAGVTEGRAIDNFNNVSGYSIDDFGNGLLDAVEYIRGPDGTVTLLRNPNDGELLHGIGQGMNSRGAIVGDYYLPGGPPFTRHGYILDGSTFTDLALPGAPNARVSARGVNDSGTVVGFALTGGTLQGFIYDRGGFTFFNHPGADFTFFQDINNSGLVAGTWSDGASHAFLYNTRNGAITEIDVPGANNVQLFSLNDLGYTVISTDISSGPSNFLYVPHGGSNAFGVAASVPEPGTWAMLIVGVAGAGAVLRRRRGVQAA